MIWGHCHSVLLFQWQQGDERFMELCKVHVDTIQVQYNCILLLMLLYIWYILLLTKCTHDCALRCHINCCNYYHTLEHRWYWAFIVSEGLAQGACAVTAPLQVERSNHEGPCPFHAVWSTVTILEMCVSLAHIYISWYRCAYNVMLV